MIGRGAGGVFGASEDVGEGRFQEPSTGDAGDPKGGDEIARGFDAIVRSQHIFVAVLDDGPATPKANRNGNKGRRELREGEKRGV